MEHEYVALMWNTLNYVSDARFMRERGELLSQGWEFYAQAQRFENPEGGACIMRRPKDEPQNYFHTPHCLCDECAKKKDEPRKWTETEIQEIAKGVLAAHVNLSAL